MINISCQGESSALGFTDTILANEPLKKHIQMSEILVGQSAKGKPLSTLILSWHSFKLLALAVREKQKRKYEIIS
jgi:hypothetical protein